ncbi:MAG: VTT domain-containing protein [Anaerolineae bacterium]
MKPWIKVGLLIVVLVVVAALAMRYARPLLDFLGNEQLIQAWLDRIGPLGPLGLIALNALQVIVAFIPGYAMSIASGFLYGFPVGAIYGALGMALGGLIAMALARTFGRPLVSRMVGGQRLQRWEEVAHLELAAHLVLLDVGTVRRCALLYRRTNHHRLLEDHRHRAGAAYPIGHGDGGGRRRAGGLAFALGHRRGHPADGVSAGSHALPKSHRDLHRSASAAQGGQPYSLPSTRAPKRRCAAGGGGLRCRSPLTIPPPLNRRTRC